MANPAIPKDDLLGQALATSPGNSPLERLLAGKQHYIHYKPTATDVKKHALLRDYLVQMEDRVVDVGQVSKGMWLTLGLIVIVLEVLSLFHLGKPSLQLTTDSVDKLLVQFNSSALLQLMVKLFRPFL